MNLYPYSEVIITSSTVAQANKMVEEKIRDELIKKLSPYLLYMFDNEYLVLTKLDEGYRLENKLNGSTLKVLPCMDSSRGSRATLLIYEECRLLKKGMIDSVFEKMAHPRQAKYFVSNSEYSTNSRWREECQHIYITSARYKYEWFWTLFKTVFTRMYTDKYATCSVFAGDIFMAIDNGLKTWGDYRNGKASGEMDFHMEDLNEMIGEAEDAFFTIKSFKENQTIENAFKPPTPVQVVMNLLPKNRPKELDKEVRLIGADFAFADTTSNQKNDNTIIILMSLIWNGKKFLRQVEMVAGHRASDSLGATDRIRELKYDYDADYVVMDLKNGGEVLFNYLGLYKENPERGSHWNPHGLGITDGNKYQLISSNKLADLKSRTVDKDYIPCLIPMIGTSELNSIMWAELKRQLENGNLKFLISMSNRQEILEDTGEYFNLTPENLAKELEPYGQTDLLIQEAINLKTELRNDKIKLVEPKSGTKDRIVILSYLNYIASMIENSWQKQSQDDDFDVDDIQLVW